MPRKDFREEQRLSAARAVGLLLGVAADSLVRRPGWLGRLRWPTPAADGLRTGLTVSAAVLAGAAVERIGRRNPVLQAAGTAVATWAVLGGAALAAEGTAMARELDASDLVAARRRLPRLCVHDPSTLDSAGLARAAVESVAENTSDVVVAPLLWGAVAGVPGLLGYRAVQALDGSGFGGARARWVAARLDELASLVPARAAAVLTAACAPVVGGSAPDAWQVWRRDGSAHPRPSHGQVEAAFAGALQVRLGGRTCGRDGVQQRPVLGHGRAPDAGDLTRGVELSRVVGAAAAAGSALLALLLSARRR